MSSNAARALSGYRRLFRARNKLFQGDSRALRESRYAIRAEFDKNRNVSDPYQLDGFLRMIDEAEDMMLHGIVQGVLNERGNYGTLQYTATVFAGYEVRIRNDIKVTNIVFFSLLSEVKLSGNHVDKTVEPITAATVSKMTEVKVDVTKSKPS